MQPAHGNSTNGAPVCLALSPEFLPSIPHLSRGQEVVKAHFLMPFVPAFRAPVPQRVTEFQGRCVKGLGVLCTRGPNGHQNPRFI